MDRVSAKIRRLQDDQFSNPEAGQEDEDRMRLLSISDREAGLLPLYDPERSFADNLSAFARQDSLFFRCAEERAEEAFRSPESYTPLLYGMAIGKHRLSDLAEYTGYPLKKCQKYLQTLCSAGLAEKIELSVSDRRSRSGYFLTSGYVGFWCRFLMYPNQEQSFSEMLAYIDQELVPAVFTKHCLRWLRRHVVDFRAEESRGKSPFSSIRFLSIWAGKRIQDNLHAGSFFGLNLRYSERGKRRWRCPFVL